MLPIAYLSYENIYYMAVYVIDINEKSARGKELKQMLSTRQPAMKFYSLEEFEQQEEKALMGIMRKQGKEKLVSAAEVRNTLARLKKQAAK